MSSMRDLHIFHNVTWVAELACARETGPVRRASSCCALHIVLGCLLGIALGYLVRMLL